MTRPLGIKNKEYKRILLRNIEKAMGDNYFRLSLFFLLAPFYLIYMGLIYFAILPLVLYCNCTDGHNNEKEKWA